MQKNATIKAYFARPFNILQGAHRFLNYLNVNEVDMHRVLCYSGMR